MIHKHEQSTEIATATEHTQTTTQNKYAKVIAISSGKGGVGKSFLSTNLAIAFSNAGNSVCLFDADTNMANINILLGITPLHTLQHFLTQSIALQDILIKGTAGIDIIAGASGVSDFIRLSQTQQQKLVDGLGSLEKNYNYLLIDTAAGVDETNLNLILAAPYLIVVITGEPTSLTDAFSLLRILKKYHFCRPVLVIVNMADNRLSAQAIFTRFKNAVSQYLQLKSYLAGYVLRDKNIPISIVQQQPLIVSSPESPASRCIIRIGRRLMGVFEQRQQTTSSFSNYFADLIIADEIHESVNEIEFTPPPPESFQKKKARIVAKNLLTDNLQAKNSALLRASYFARLLSKEESLAAKKINRNVL